MRWPQALLLFFTVPGIAHSQPQPQTVRIGVLSIFHPQQLTLSADQPEGLLISTGDQQLFLQPRSACSLLRIRSSGDGLLLNCTGREIRARQLRASSRDQQEAAFHLSIPGKINRRYEGILELSAKHGELIPLILMDLETAIASVVKAETLPNTPPEALKAQAVVTRSYFVAGGGRHSDFDFCDLTHCQFLREPPPPDSPAAKASAATRGLVLTFEDKAVAAMFTRSCGGHTRTPREIGLPQSSYTYFSVQCPVCYSAPFRWTRTVSPDDAALLFAHGENGRLAIGRKLGWNAVPSNNFTARKQNGEVLLRGVGQGHGVGLCQRGARALAQKGFDFRAILALYYPNTRCGLLHTFPE